MKGYEFVKYIEIEAKMRLEDRAGIEQKLRELGATNRRQVIESNTFFDTSEGRLRSSDQGLRIRVELDEDGVRTATITHKGPRAHGRLKSRAESEVRVEDAHKATALLNALGYQPGLSFEKRRTRYELDGCHVELDTLPYLGDFIEIEGSSEAAVLAVRKKLGLEDVPLEQASYIAMLTHYLRERGLSVRHIGFDVSSQPVSAAR